MDVIVKLNNTKKFRSNVLKNKTTRNRLIAVILIIIFIIISITSIVRNHYFETMAINYYIDRIELRSFLDDNQDDEYTKKINCAANSYIINNSTTIEEKNVFDYYNKIFGKDSKVTNDSIRYILSDRKLLKLNDNENQSKDLKNTGKSFVKINSINEKLWSRYEVNLDVVSEANLDEIRNYYSNPDRNGTIDFTNLNENDDSSNVNLSLYLTNDNYKELAKGYIKKLSIILKYENGNFKIVNYKIK